MKKVFGFFKWVGIIIVALIVLGVISAIFGGGKSSVDSAKVGEKTTETVKTTSNTPELKASYKVGDIVSVGDYLVTVNSFKNNIATDNQFIVPKDGNQFVQVDITIENKGKDKTNISTLLQMYVKDSEGSKFNQTFIPDQKSLDGELLSGDKVKGQLTYEVPKNVSGMKYYYNAAFLFGKSIVVDLQ